jgi:hypothetical protein
MTTKIKPPYATPGHAFGHGIEHAYNLGRNHGLIRAINILYEIKKYDTSLTDLEHGMILAMIAAIRNRGGWGKEPVQQDDGCFGAIKK